MHITGIIAEYNPFHNGHLYHIKNTKSRTQTDYIIAVMSGDFVQRGEPAIIDKYTRAKMALLGGADMVIELPTIWATSSAPDFASGAVALLDKLGCISALSFGCEFENANLLDEISDILYVEPDVYKTTLKEALKEGETFAKAKAIAISKALKDKDYDDEELSGILKAPNTLLALEYIRKIKERNSIIFPVIIKRYGSEHTDSKLSAKYTSAASIRKHLYNHPSAMFSLKDVMPSSSYELMGQYLSEKAPLYADDFSMALSYRLATMNKDEIEDMASSGRELSRRISSMCDEFTQWTTFCKSIKSKNFTYSRISRLMTAILLDKKKEILDKAKEYDYVPYARILGFKKNSASKLMRYLKEHTQIPLITSPSDAIMQLSPDDFKLFEFDMKAAAIYNSVITQKTKIPCQNEYRKALITV